MSSYLGSKLIKFEVKPFTESRVMGKSVLVRWPSDDTDDPTIPDLLLKMANDGSFDFLFNLPNRVTEAHDKVAWMGDWKPGDTDFTCLAGVLFKGNTPVPDGYVYRDIPGCEMAIGWIEATEGEEGGNVHANASDHISRAMKENGYKYDGSKGFEMFCYSYERFGEVPEKRGAKVILDFCSPCKKAN